MKLKSILKVLLVPCLIVSFPVIADAATGFVKTKPAFAKIKSVEFPAEVESIRYSKGVISASKEYCTDGWCISTHPDRTLRATYAKDTARKPDVEQISITGLSCSRYLNRNTLCSMTLRWQKGSTGRGGYLVKCKVHIADLGVADLIDCPKKVNYKED